jgi:hypothetical protein
MIESLDIDFVYGETTYASFEGLVRAPYTERDFRAHQDNSRLGGQVIIDARASKSAVGLVFEDRTCLLLECNGILVDWAIVGDQSVRGVVQTYAEEVSVRFSGSDAKIWRPLAALRELLGLRVKAISPSETTIFVYPRGHRELFFCPAVDAAGEPVLYFQEGDPAPGDVDGT